jgi:hypothetical protein
VAEFVRKEPNSDMKNLWRIGIISLCWISPLLSQQQPQSPAIPAVSCEDQANALSSMSYPRAVMDQFWPPEFAIARGITVAVQLSWGANAFLRAQDGKYWESLKIDEWDLPINGQPTSMIKWVHQFQREVEQAFHGKFVRGKGWTPQ